MQKFCNEWGKRRRINLKSMTEREARQYASCFSNISKKQEIDLIKRIKENNNAQGEICKWILSIQDPSEKIIGKIELFDMGTKKAYLSITIPQKSWIMKYGNEAIDQIIKVCKEHKCFESIELECNNPIIKGFIENYASVYEFSEEYVVNIA